jgi:hypothetical protein
VEQAPPGVLTTPRAPGPQRDHCYSIGSCSKPSSCIAVPHWILICSWSRTISLITFGSIGASDSCYPLESSWFQLAGDLVQFLRPLFFSIEGHDLRPQTLSLHDQKNDQVHDQGCACLLSSPQLGFFLHLLLRNPGLGRENTLSALPLKP